MSIIVGIRNLILRILFRIMRPVIFLMDPEQAHYSMKRIGVFLGSNFITRAFTSLLYDYGHKSLNIKELSNFIQSKNKKYILDLDKESSIHFFNRIIKEFKEKDIKKVFVNLIEKENDK